jgi:hypothetical protein
MISSKVSAATLTGTATGALTWILTYFVPAWHHGIPSSLAQALPWLVGTAGAFGGGYAAKHRATAAEIDAAIVDAEKVLQSAHVLTTAAATETAPAAAGTAQAPPVEGVSTPAAPAAP